MCYDLKLFYLKKTYLCLVFGEPLADETERRLAILDLTGSVNQILAVVQLWSHVADGPHVTDKGAAVGVDPAQYDVRLRLAVY